MKLYNSYMLFLLLLISPSICIAQYSFEKTVSTTDSEAFFCAFEDQMGKYVCVGRLFIQEVDYSLSPFVVKFNPDGTIVESKTFIKTDTTAVFQFGFQKDNGNYLFLGTMSDSITPSERNFTYLCETNQDFQILQERYYKIPDPFHSHTIENYLITPENNLIIGGRADSSLYGYNNELILSKFDMEGNLLNLSMPENWSDSHSRGDIINTPNGEGFYLIGEILEYSFPKDWVEFDYNLNLLDYGDIEDSLSYMGLPLSVKRLANGNYFMANASYQYPPYDADDLEIRILDEDFSIIKDTILYYDEEMYLPVHTGLDFINENNIWVSVFEELPSSLPGTEEFDVHIFDSEMRLKGTGTYGGDQRYWLYDVTATSDGGCLIVGNVPDYDGSTIKDAYVIKIMPEDIITGIDAPAIASETGNSVFPNPFRDVLYVESSAGEMVLTLFNMYGQDVFVKDIPNNRKIEILTSGMKPGVYSYIIENKNGIIVSGKLIKN